MSLRNTSLPGFLVNNTSVTKIMFPCQRTWLKDTDIQYINTTLEHAAAVRSYIVQSVQDCLISTTNRAQSMMATGFSESW